MEFSHETFNQSLQGFCGYMDGRLKGFYCSSELIMLSSLQGHIRVGPDTVTDPAFLVTRNMEDFVTWVDTSKIKRKVLKYSDKLDDYLLLQ
jgi:hypothetical protein